MTSSLENLPAELRIQILQSLTDFPSLRCLIHASPLYHATYLQFRGEVLYHLSLYQLDHTLRPDALAAVRSKRQDERSVHNPEAVFALLDDYGIARAEASLAKTEWLSCSSITEALDLLRLHETVKRVTEEYCRSIASKMSPKEAQQQPLRLSKMEQLRFHRAIYRFQLYCNLFGAAARWTSERDRGRSSDHVPKVRFFAAFPPWEVQEIAGIWHHLNRRWASILRQVSDIFFPKHISKGGPDSDLEDTFEYLRFTRHGSPQERNPDILSQQQAISSTSNQEIVESRTHETESSYSHHHRHAYEERRNSLAHQGPQFLDQALAHGTLEHLRDIVRDTYTRTLFSPFDEHLEKLYLHNVESWRERPESEQPSRGWKWFAHKYEVDCFDLTTRVGDNFTLASWGRRLDGARYELSWGYPYWDKEKLERWGVIMAAEGKKKKKKKKRKEKVKTGNESER